MAWQIQISIKVDNSQVTKLAHGGQASSLIKAMQDYQADHKRE